MESDFLRYDEKDFSGVALCDWNVLSYHRPISSATIIDNYSKELDIAIPEMIFGENFLLIKHATSGFTINLNAYDALKLVEKGPHSADKIQVNHSKTWKESNFAKNPSITNVVKPFDWTFSCEYFGTLSEHLTFKPTTKKIDYEKLKTLEPLLYFDQNTLFEDDLGDNGISSLSYKIKLPKSNTENQNLSVLNDSNYVRQLMDDTPDFVISEIIEY
ncbi:hypothetical protein BB561_003658 [Smittium simulii]|uniref:TIP41-like protein n=1 Tax=Smittium simulii TaxID=133385 RepID=A0A2T9YK61_9FUNG|nr:hypothetical protein BB561_003658 [Smittium simulii]